MTGMVGKRAHGLSGLWYVVSVDDVISILPIRSVNIMSGAPRQIEPKANKTDNLFRGLSSLREQERRKEEALVPKKVNSALNVGT